MQEAAYATLTSQLQAYFETCRAPPRTGNASHGRVPLNVYPTNDGYVAMTSDTTLLCTCLAGAATTRQIEDWLAAAGFNDIEITIKPGSRELVESWAPGRGIENYAASATIGARKLDSQMARK